MADLQAGLERPLTATSGSNGLARLDLLVASLRAALARAADRGRRRGDRRAHRAAADARARAGRHRPERDGGRPRATSSR
jgi:hypothetical protein